MAPTPNGLRFLSEEWVDSLATDAASAGDRPERDVGDDALTVQVRVVGAEEPTGDPTCWVLAVGADGVEVRPGIVDTPTVWMELDADVARRLSQGETRAQTEFMTGGLRVGGDLSVLVDHAALLGSLGDVFARTRAATTYPDDG